MVEAKRQLSDLFLESRAEDLEKKVGKPNLIGSFEQGANPPMNFRLYILEVHEMESGIRLREDADDFDLPIKMQKMEGVILDGIGLAIFSGWKTRDAIMFVKTYSKFGGESGGARNILYQGRYNESSKSYHGTFKLIGDQGTEKRPPYGTFEIKESPTENIPKPTV
jgi:hypothetical protein